MKAFRDLLEHCMDKNNPKPELDGILIDGNKLICTDTKQLLVLEFKEDFCAAKDETTMLFEKLPKDFAGAHRPKEFVSILDANSGIVEELGFKLCVPYHDCGVNAKFPDYERIMRPLSKEQYKGSEFNFDGFRNSDDLLLFKSTILNNALFDGRFLARFAQLLLKTHLAFKVTISQKNADMPLHIYAKVMEMEEHVLVSINYIVMPIILDEKDRQVA